MKASLEDNSSYEESLEKAESELETAKVMLDEYIRSASVSQSILRYSLTAFLGRGKASHAAVLSKSFVKRLPPYAHGTAEYCTPCSLHMMCSSFCLNKKKKATHVKGPLLTHFFCLPGHIRGTSCHRRDICCLPSSSPLQSL